MSCSFNIYTNKISLNRKIPFALSKSTILMPLSILPPVYSLFLSNLYFYPVWGTFLSLLSQFEPILAAFLPPSSRVLLLQLKYNQMISWKFTMRTTFKLIMQAINAKSFVFAGSLESANSSILAARNLFKDFGGEKNQDFMIIRWPISWFVYQWRHDVIILRASTWSNVTTSFYLGFRLIKVIMILTPAHARSVAIGHFFYSIIQ